MKKILRSLFQDNYSKTAFGLFLIGLFLRLYRLNDFVTFLGDQGRDSIIIKRILTLEHLPAIGAPTSVGQVYLGPFYYYLIAPWLWVFRFEPIGLAVGTAVFSSLYLLVNYFAVKDLFDKKVALISTVLITFASVLIEFSRFSWNPNLLPLFSLIAFYAFVKAVRTRKAIFFLLAGAFLSFAIQLHYLALFLLPPVATVFMTIAIKKQERLKQILKDILMLVASFLFFSLPLVIFDLRHDFLNSRNFIKLFKTADNVASNKIATFIDTFVSLNAYFFSITLNSFVWIVILAGIIVVLFITMKKNFSLRLLTLFLLLLILGLSLYSGPKYPHYFGMIYPLYAIVIGYLLSLLFFSKWGGLAVIIFLAVYVGLQTQGYAFLFGQTFRQIDHAKRVSGFIEGQITSRKYTVTALPQMYSDSVYRYFLEIGGERAIEKDSLERADELFVVCEGDCWPIGDPQWDIAYFAPTKAILKRQIDHVTIYKLTR